MTNCYIEFWRGGERVFEYEGDEFSNPDDARHHIEDLLHQMMRDSAVEDWTGCRFEVATERGKTVLQVPVLATMSALARRSSH
jgi:hypothetical protein